MIVYTDDEKELIKRAFDIPRERKHLNFSDWTAKDYADIENFFMDNPIAGAKLGYLLYKKGATLPKDTSGWLDINRKHCITLGFPEIRLPYVASVNFSQCDIDNWEGPDQKIIVADGTESIFEIRGMTITSVVLPDTLRRIAGEGLQHTSVKTIKLPASMTSLGGIPFPQNCSVLLSNKNKGLYLDPKAVGWIKEHTKYFEE